MEGLTGSVPGVWGRSLLEAEAKCENSCIIFNVFLYKIKDLMSIEADLGQ